MAINVVCGRCLATDVCIPQEWSPRPLLDMVRRIAEISRPVFCSDKPGEPFRVACRRKERYDAGGFVLDRANCRTICGRLTVGAGHRRNPHHYPSHPYLFIGRVVARLWNDRFGPATDVVARSGCLTREHSF